MTSLGDPPSLHFLLKTKAKIDPWHLYKKICIFFLRKNPSCGCLYRPTDTYSNRSVTSLTKRYLHCNNIEVSSISIYTFEFEIYTFIILKKKSYVSNKTTSDVLYFYIKKHQKYSPHTPAAEDLFWFCSLSYWGFKDGWKKVLSLLKT